MNVLYNFALKIQKKLNLKINTIDYIYYFAIYFRDCVGTVSNTSFCIFINSFSYLLYYS